MNGVSGAVGGLLSPSHSEPKVATDDPQTSELESDCCSQNHRLASEDPLLMTLEDNYSSKLKVTSGSQSLKADSHSCSDCQGSSQPTDKSHEDASDVENKENETAGPTEEKTSQYSNPVFSELSIINGEINRLNRNQLKHRLRLLRLDTKGRNDVLQKRLKTHYRLQKLKEVNIDDPAVNRQHYYDYYVVIDFEATCDDRDPHQFRHEIIEFPAVLVSTKRCKVVDEFHSYVRPGINPKLTNFCTSLTGITQDKVNFAPMFSEVLQKFEEWLKKHKLTSKPEKFKFAVVTDGPWDMGRFLFQQCIMSKVPYPSWAVKWINIRKNYSNFYNTKRMCLKDMLNKLGMRFEGQPHCGMDDSRNIARVAIKLLKDGANMRVNERVHLRKDGNYNPRERVVHNISRHNFNDMKKKLLESDTGNDGKCKNGNDWRGGDEDNLDPECGDDFHADSEHSKLWVDPTDREEFPDLMFKPQKISH